MEITFNQIDDVLAQVLDPEVPVLSVVDLGIIHRIYYDENRQLHIDVLPTYSGCPAMDEIEISIKSALEDNGFSNVTLHRVLDPAWNSDMITSEGHRKLKEYGIAPPLSRQADKAALFEGQRKVPCPQCNSTNTRLVSFFGSTACKSLFQCEDCKEPFDYFKCH